jgi:hypothetical protein
MLKKAGIPEPVGRHAAIANTLASIATRKESERLVREAKKTRPPAKAKRR